MNFFTKVTKLTDGSKVHDVILPTNSMDGAGTNARVIISCTSERDAREFIVGLDKLMGKHTVEILEEI